MTDTPLWILLITSAGIGAFVSSVTTFVGQLFERRARRKELLLTKAIELAQARSRMVLEISQKENRPASIQDDVISAEGYYQWLLHLLEHGELPDDPRLIRIAPKNELARGGDSGKS